MPHIDTYTAQSAWENLCDYGSNLLTGDQTDFEGGTTGSWTGSASYTPSNTTDQAQAGTHSLKLVSAATGAKTAISPALTVVAGTIYGGYAYVRANTTTRLIQPTISWYSDAGATTLISTTVGSAWYVETNTSWIRVQVAGTAPGTAIRAKLNIIWANSANPETHYLDTAFFGTAIAGNTTAPTAKIEAWGRGGTGGAAAVAVAGGGGGGGAYSRIDAFALVPGHSYSVVPGTSGARDSYFSAIGSTTTSTAEGILAKGGANGTAGSGVTPGTGGAGGTTAASIGDTKFAGAAGNAAVGGGGAGDANAGSGQTGGSAGGGNGATTGPTAGSASGGGGGGGAIPSGAGGAGGAAQVVVTYNFTTTEPVFATTMTGTASMEKIQQYARAFTYTMTGTYSFTRLITAFRTFTYTMTGTYTFAKIVAAIRNFTYTVTGTSSLLKTIGKPFAYTVTGTTSLVRSVGKLLSTTVTGTPSVIKAITKGAFTYTMTGTAIFQRAIISARTFTYTVTGSANTLLQFSTTILNRITGGGTTIVKKVITYIFDD